jgi:hypothetical protein
VKASTALTPNVSLKARTRAGFGGSVMLPSGKSTMSRV